MMRIEQKQLAQFCGILQALVPECRLTINSEGWNTMAVDTANVAIVGAVMGKDRFESFDIQTKTELGMDMPRWKYMLSVMADPKATISIEDEKDTGKVRITDGKYTYRHAPLDVTVVRKRPNPPTLNLPAKIIIDAKELQEVIRAVSIIGDKAKFTACKDGLVLDTEGDTDRLNKAIPGKSGSILPDAPISSLFSLDYLKDMAKAMKDAGDLTVLVGKDHPIRFEFELDGIEAFFMLAPRIEQEG